MVDRCEAAINNDWGTGSPAPGVNADGFSASWDGSFTFAAGTYTFTATGDDGIRVYVDGTKVIDGWKDQSATTYTAPVTLTAGSHAVQGRVLRQHGLRRREGQLAGDGDRRTRPRRR